MSSFGRKYRTERTGDGLVTFTPEEGKHSASMILLHGLGDTSDGWSDVAETWIRSSSLEHVKFILPTAAPRPVTMNGGYRMPAWYDIVGLTARENEECDGINESIDKVRAIVQQEVALGIPHHRIVLAGFSQGGALSLYAGLSQSADEKLAGILVMSGYLPATKSFRLTDAHKDVPVLHCHGTQDPVVRFEWAQKTQTHLEELGHSKYQFKSYPIPHTVSPQVIDDASNFLQSIIPHDEAFAIKPKEPSEMSVKELKAAVRNAGLADKAKGFTEKSEFVQLLLEHRQK